ncbi:solute carrier family 40 member 2-like isoform X1 [Salvia splendens]|uniref:solute carrier family 40 member 2-like isoform X1 n=2 Tax=Salvia splendens TaxID=180675 RepID=UPI001C26974F|nr:solute carrier family 40 member 2-like isoform X1 [Salvia splendens]
MEITKGEQLAVQTHSFPSSSVLNLYVGHFLARWGSRMWEFSVGLYMINVWPDSLLVAAAYGVVECASTAIFGPLIGQLVDKLSYTRVLQLWLLSQNLSFAVAGVAVVAILMYTDLVTANYTVFISLLVLINISGAVAVLSTLAGTILVEREWVVVISEGQSPGVLTKMNSVIRRIDLICKLFAPVITGFVISFVSLTASALALAIWNIVSVFLIYILLMSVYKGIPRLRDVSERRVSVASRSLVGGVDESVSTYHERESLITSDANYSESSPNGIMIEKFLSLPYVRAWRVYINQDVVLPGLALAWLYFTVLGFGPLMTATLEWQGIPAYVIGIARGISAMVGIGATFGYPMLESRISTLRTGLWSIWSQWGCLLLCVASVLMRSKISSAYVLMAGVASSRLGLWMFDLSVIQQMQDGVAESDRCVVGGVQNSIQSMMDLMTYIMAILISNPKDFWKLIVLSFVVATLAAILYTVHIYRVRKHLIHWDKLLRLIKW